MLEYGKTQREAGKPVADLCKTLSLPRSTLYRWEADPEKESGSASKEAPAALVWAMRDDVRRLDHVKRRTYGTATIYRVYEGVIPRSVIADTIREERSRHCRIERDRALRYEFSAVNLAQSVDFIDVRGGGRVYRVQEEYARYTLGYKHRMEWPAHEVARFTQGIFARWGFPYVLKHDLGPEFRSGVFQAMLRAYKILPLPNPPWWPRANGKHERRNLDMDQWMLPFADERLPVEEVLAELGGAVEDNNEIRPREILGWKTPLRVFETGPRVKLNREELYAQWSRHKEKLMFSRTGARGIIVEPGDEFAAMRLATMAVLIERRLVRFFFGRGGPEVSP